MPRFRRKRLKPSVVTLADGARDTGQWEIAVGYYRVALQRNPQNPPIWVQYGHVLKEAGHLAEAEKAYRTAIYYDPRDPDSHLQLGHVLKMQGNSSEARNSYLRALALEPSAPYPLDELRDLGWSAKQLSELLTLVRPDHFEAPPSDLRGGYSAHTIARLDNSHDAHEILRSDNYLDRPINSRRITISILIFSNCTKCITLISQLCTWLSDKTNTLGIAPTIVVRNNNPQLDITRLQEHWKMLKQNFLSIRFVLFNEGFNVGFGWGHNLNFVAAECDYFLILNDDIAFPHINWLDEALAIFESKPKIGAIGARDSPNSVTPFFANGVVERRGMHWPLRYAEASILLVRAKVFDEIGQFDNAYEWAMCEDSDLSFRIQAHGYDLEWIEILHQHWRSSSFNILPSSIKSAILEHNRSVLFSKWNVALTENKIGRVQIYDLWSEGIGDVFCALLHLRIFTDGLTKGQKDTIILNTSCPEIAQILFEKQIVIESIADLRELRSKYATEGVRSLKSTRGVNYGLPFNIHVLVCSMLGIPVAAHEQLTAILAERLGAGDTTLVPLLPSASYCVLHLESERTGHDGRVPSPATLQSIVTTVADVFDNVVLVGKRKFLRDDQFANPRAKIIDLQGQLSIKSLIAVICGADGFVGIDSFPAHVAQVAYVRSAIFFGSVHPTFRVLSERVTWPIVKPIDCIGCYHISLEPGIPFCMRRDLACTTDISPDILRAAIAGCASMESFDWHRLTMQAFELQRKFFMKLLFHPAPERRFFDPRGISAETASNLVYQIIDQAQDAVLSSLPIS
jgi:tetratricopeptide (TPR) repeat protein